MIRDLYHHTRAHRLTDIVASESRQGGDFPGCSLSCLVVSFLLFGVVALLGGASAHAFSLQGEVTSLSWNREVPELQDTPTRWQMYESFRLRGAQGNVSFYLHAHAARFEDWQTDLYQGYLDLQLSPLRIRLGRQYLPNDAGFWEMDGVRADLRRAGLRLGLYGGRGLSGWATNRSNVLGGDLLFARPRFVRARASLTTLFDGDGMQRVLLGGQLGTLNGSMLGVHGSTSSPVEAFGRASVDLLAHTLVSGFAHASLTIEPVRLYAEFKQEMPLFPEDSIFTVFAIEPLKRGSVGLEIELSPWLQIEGRYSRQLYDAGPLNRYRLGIQVGPLYSFLERIEDGFVEYWRTYSGVRMERGPLGLQLSHYYNDYRKSALSVFETAYSYQAQVAYELGRSWQLRLRLEDNVNPDFKYNVRVLGSIRWRFGWRQR